MKKLLLIGLLAFVGSATSQAKTFKMGEGTPFVTISIPDSWDADGTETVVAGSDHGAFLSAETASGKETDALIDKSVDYLTEQGVTIDEKTIEKSQKEINGLTTVFITASGKDKDGPTQVGLVITLVPDDHALLLTYWGPPGDDKDLTADLTSILQSIKAL